MKPIGFYSEKVLMDRVGSSAQKHFQFHLDATCSRTDRVFVPIFLLQWALAIIFAWKLAPRTWVAQQALTDTYLWYAVFLGGALSTLPIFLATRFPGRTLTRYTIAVSQVAFSSLLIHVSGGRPETHFHIFGSIALLSFYREPRILILSTTLVAFDQMFRGAFFPETTYGVFTPTYLRWIENTAWLVFEDIFLINMIRENIRELKESAQTRAFLEGHSLEVEKKVEMRTVELLKKSRHLEQSQQKFADQQAKMITSARLSSLGEMAGGIAHEINNPIAIIMGKTSQMRRRMEKPAFDIMAVRQDLEKVEKTCERIVKIVKGLRSFSRSGEKDVMKIESVDALLDDTLEFCRERFKSHGIALRVHAETPNLSVECRGVQITQVFLNLLNNAYDAVVGTTEPWIEVNYGLVDAGLIKIQVTDSGGGIPAAVAGRLMEPFFTTKGVGKGTGLGLSISKGIVEDHDGRLFVDHACPNTRFVIELPTISQQKAAA